MTGIALLHSLMVQKQGLFTLNIFNFASLQTSLESDQVMVSPDVTGYFKGLDL